MSVPSDRCPLCGSPLQPTDAACPVCGQPVAPRPGTPPPYIPPLPGEPPWFPGPELPPSATSAPDREPFPEASGPPPPPPPPPSAAPTPSLPAGGPGQAEAQVAAAGTDPTPWEARRRHGFLTALWLTWRDSMFQPVVFFRRLPPRGGYGPAVGYATVLTAFALVFSFYWSFVKLALAGELQGSLGAAVVEWLAGLVFGGGLMLAVYIGFLYASVAIIHLGFRIVGAGRFGYEATFRATAYSSGPAAFAIFPFFGPLLGLVWGSVLLYIGVREVQRTSNGRAAAGFLLPVVLFVFLGVLAALLLAVLVSMTELGTPAA